MNPHETIIFETSFPVKGGTFEGAGRAATRIKELLKDMGFANEIVRRAATIVYEAEINICSYALSGTILLRVTTEGITIEATDVGEGIPDIDLAMKEGYSTATERIRQMGFGAGMGLTNIKTFSDSFHITSETGRGTHLKMVITFDDADSKEPPG
jgi:anti-sigma regulatory factor (Ser/Thr protein kinase)